jgi:hypothetical protein
MIDSPSGQGRAASITVVAYGFDEAFPGLHIAAPAFRGRGIGFALWQAGLLQGTAPASSRPGALTATAVPLSSSRMA